MVLVDGALPSTSADCSLFGTSGSRISTCPKSTWSDVLAYQNPKVFYKLVPKTKNKKIVTSVKPVEADEMVDLDLDVNVRTEQQRRT